MKEKKAILMFHQGAELYGSDKIFRLTVESLSSLYEVDVVIPEDGPLIEMLKSAGARNIYIRDLAVLRRSKVNSFIKIVSHVIRVLCVICQLVMFQRRNRYVFFYVNTLAVFAPLVAGKITGVRRLSHVHEIQSSPKLLFKLLYRLNYILSDVMVVVSAAVKEHVEYMIGHPDLAGKIKLIRNGIYREVMGLGAVESLRAELAENNEVDENTKIIAMVGRIHTWKGQSQLLDSMRDLIDRFQYENFVVVFFGGYFEGYSDYYDHFQQKIAKLNLSKHVYCGGERADVSALFEIADFSVLPSTLPDPLPTVVLESMMCATPVVSYKHGGALEMIEDEVSGLFAEVGSTSSFAQCMYRMLSNDDERHRFGLASNARYEKMFSFDAYKNAQQELIGSVI